MLRLMTDTPEEIDPQDIKHTDDPNEVPEVRPEPTPEDVATWTAAIHEIMERDGVTEEQANAGLVWALVDYEIQQNIRELARERDEALWGEVIVSLMYRNPTWTEQEANDNLVNLLQWVEAHPGEDYTPPDA